MNRPGTTRYRPGTYRVRVTRDPVLTLREYRVTPGGEPASRLRPGTSYLVPGGEPSRPRVLEVVRTGRWARAFELVELEQARRDRLTRAELEREGPGYGADLLDHAASRASAEDAAKGREGAAIVCRNSPGNLVAQRSPACGPEHFRFQNAPLGAPTIRRETSEDQAENIAPGARLPGGNPGCGATP